MKPNRIIVQLGSNLYFFLINKKLGCGDCDINECGGFREVCYALGGNVGKGIFQKRNYKIDVLDNK